MPLVRPADTYVLVTYAWATVVDRECPFVLAASGPSVARPIASVSGNDICRSCFRVFALSCYTWSIIVRWRPSPSAAIVTQLVTHLQARGRARPSMRTTGAHEDLTPPAACKARLPQDHFSSLGLGLFVPKPNARCGLRPLLRRLTCLVPSVGRPLVSVAVATQLVTYPPAGIEAELRYDASYALSHALVVVFFLVSGRWNILTLECSADSCVNPAMGYEYYCSICTKPQLELNLAEFIFIRKGVYVRYKVFHLLDDLDPVGLDNFFTLPKHMFHCFAESMLFGDTNAIREITREEDYIRIRYPWV